MGDQQETADAVERVVLAAPVAEGLVGGAPADLIERRVGQADGVEVIDHQVRVWEPVGDAAGVAGVGIERHRRDRGAPRARPTSEPVGHPGGGAALDHVDEPVTVEIDEPCDQQRRVPRRGR